MLADAINGSFETLGGLFVLMNVIRLHRDKEIKGVCILPVLFFASWGCWNVYFYESLGQPLSWYGSIGVTSMNIVWLSQMIWYRRKSNNDAG